MVQGATLVRDLELLERGQDEFECGVVGAARRRTGINVTHAAQLTVQRSRLLDVVRAWHGVLDVDVAPCSP